MGVASGCGEQEVGVGGIYGTSVGSGAGAGAPLNQGARGLGTPENLRQVVCVRYPRTFSS